MKKIIQEREFEINGITIKTRILAIENFFRVVYFKNEGQRTSVAFDTEAEAKAFEKGIRYGAEDLL